MKQRLLLFLALSLLLLSACSAAASSANLVGEAANSDIALGLAMQDGRVLVYACDGTEVSEWFNGDVAGEDLDLTSAGGAHLQAQVNADGATGTLTLASGEAVAFTLAPASGDAGLYRAEESFDDGDYVAGWVVLNNGRQVGRVVNIADGTSNTVVQLQPNVNTDGIIAILIGNRNFDVRPGSTYIEQDN